MANGNPFYVEPGTQFGQGLSQLGQIYGSYQEQKRQQQQEQEAMQRAQAGNAALRDAWQSGDPNRIQETMIEFPELQKRAESLYKFQSDKTKKDALQSYRNLLTSENPQEALEVLDRRISMVQEEGGNPADSIALRNRIANKVARGEDITPILQAEELEYSAIAPKQEWAAYQRQQGKGLSRGSTKSYQPITLVNPDTQEKMLVTPTYNPETNKAELSPFDIPEGFTVSKETAQEKRAADVIAAGEKKGEETRAKSVAERRQGYIDTGVEAAETIGNVSRAIQLLDLVETGGYDAAALRARQIFGIESADEGELANSLGKAVLSQLKPLFGGAFTKAEGDRLERISAGFGKSPAANKRILQQQLKSLDRAARRAAKVAREDGDEFTANEIEEAMRQANEVINKAAAPQQQAQAPASAIEYLRQNPQLAEQFRQKYGYVPEGI